MNLMTINIALDEVMAVVLTSGTRYELKHPHLVSQVKLVGDPISMTLAQVLPGFGVALVGTTQYDSMVVVMLDEIAAWETM